MTRFGGDYRIWKSKLISRYYEHIFLVIFLSTGNAAWNWKKFTSASRFPPIAALTESFNEIFTHSFCNTLHPSFSEFIPPAVKFALENFTRFVFAAPRAPLFPPNHLPWIQCFSPKLAVFSRVAISLLLSMAKAQCRFSICRDWNESRVHRTGLFPLSIVIQEESFSHKHCGLT